MPKPGTLQAWLIILLSDHHIKYAPSRLWPLASCIIGLFGDEEHLQGLAGVFHHVMCSGDTCVAGNRDELPHPTTTKSPLACDLGMELRMSEASELDDMHRMISCIASWNMHGWFAT